MYTNYDVYVNNSCKVVVFVVVVIVVVVVFVAAIVASSWKTDLVNNYSKKVKFQIWKSTTGIIGKTYIVKWN